MRPSLPPGYKVIEDTDLPLSQPAFGEACETGGLISLLRIGLPNTSPEGLPSWGGIHALITTASVPLMRVGVLPVIPSPGLVPWHYYMLSKYNDTFLLLPTVSSKRSTKVCPEKKRVMIMKKENNNRSFRRGSSKSPN